MRSIIGGLTALFAVFGLASVAQAHTSSADVSCTQTVVRFTAFASSGNGSGGLNRPHYAITRNGALVVDAQASFPGSSHNVTVPLALYNGDVVRVSTRWASSETRDGHSKANSVIRTYTATNCAQPPEPSCENTPSLCPPPVQPPAEPPSVVPPAGTPPVPPVPEVPESPESECIKLKRGDFRVKVIRRGQRVALKVKGPLSSRSSVRRLIDGKRVGRVISLRKWKRGHVLEVRIRDAKGCNRVRITKTIPRPRPTTPRFTG